MGKKLGLAVVGLFIVAVIYYITAGSSQLTEQMKAQVNTELSSLQTEGFSVKGREITETKEHFVLSFDEPQKIAHFLARQGVQLNVNDAELLKGLQLGIDVNYLDDTYSAVSFDMYPVALPSTIASSFVEEKDKKALAQIEQMLKKKTFLMHIAINKLGNGFKGYMKDIEEVLQGEKNVELKMKGFTFSGDIKNNVIHSVKQALQQLTMQVPNEMLFSFNTIESDYVVTGKTLYDYTMQYSIGKMTLNTNQKFSIAANDIVLKSISLVKDGLASGSMHSTVKQTNVSTKGKKYIFDTFVFDMNAHNLDVRAFEKLQQVDVNNEAEINALIQTLISKGVQFEITKLSVENIEKSTKKMGGFALTAKVDIDKSLNISASQANPMAALSAIDANLNITLSRELFGIVIQQPQAMMAMMLFQPKDVNGKKVYNLNLKDGKLTVNGMPVN